MNPAGTSSLRRHRDRRREGEITVSVVEFYAGVLAQSSHDPASAVAVDRRWRQFVLAEHFEKRRLPGEFVDGYPNLVR